MKQRFAGISIVFNEDGSKSIAFHGTKIEEAGKPHCVWLGVPGITQYFFFDLHQVMDRVEACKYLLKKTELQANFIQQFLRDTIEKYTPIDKEAAKEDRRQKRAKAIANLRNTATPKKKYKKRDAENEREKEAEKREERAEQRAQRHEHREQRHESREQNQENHEQDRENHTHAHEYKAKARDSHNGQQE